jgi:hypothetical protein
MMPLLKFVGDQILQFWPPYSIPDNGNRSSGERRAAGECPIVVPTRPVQMAPPALL